MPKMLRNVNLWILGGFDGRNIGYCLKQIKTVFIFFFQNSPGDGIFGGSLSNAAVFLLQSYIWTTLSLPPIQKNLFIFNNFNNKNWDTLNPKVLQTPENRLSNRFYPYAEIETEAVFSLDDDITMLSTDEIEFGFQVPNYFICWRFVSC